MLFLATSNGKKCIFVLKYSGLTSQLSLGGMAAIAFFIVVMMFYWNWQIILAFGAGSLLLVILPYAFGVYSFRLEFYDDKMKLFGHNKMRYELKYSDVIRIGDEHYPYRRGYSLYGEGDKFLAIIPSNPKKKELNGVSVLDWLKTKIASSKPN